MLKCISENLILLYGGEEFIICLLNTARQDAVHIAEKIRTEIETKQVKSIRERNYSYTKLGVSIGAIQDSEVTNSKLIEALMHEADRALYTAKKNGRNSVRSTEKYAVIFPKNVSFQKDTFFYANYSHGILFRRKT